MHAVDWYPTLTKLVGAHLEQKLPPDGLDIWPVLTQNAKSPHDAILLMGNKPGVSAIRPPGDSLRDSNVETKKQKKGKQ